MMERRGLGKQLTLYVDYQCVHCMTNINDLSDLLLTDFKVIGMKKISHESIIVYFS